LWFAEGNPLTLAVFRAAFALCLAAEVPSTRHMSVFAIEGGFHLPYLRLVPLLEPKLYAQVHLSQYFLILLLGLGVATRAAAGSLLFLQGWVFYADRMNFRNHPYFFLLVLAILLVSPCDDTLSLRAWLRGRRGLQAMLRPPHRPLTAQRLIQFQVVVVYVYAASMKIHPQFLGGGIVALEANRWLLGAAATDDARVALSSTFDPTVWMALSWGTIVLEGFLAVGLCWARARPLAFALGILFHLGLGLVMGVWTFSLGYLATYLLFLDPETIPCAIERASRRRRAVEAA